MRVLLLSFVGLAAASAHASSIEAFATANTRAPSVSQMPCAKCPPPIVKKSTSYIVPEVAPGTERVEIKEIDGEMRVLRTEAWLGGSPVVFVTKASEDVIKASEAAKLLNGETAATVIDPMPAAAAASATIDLSVDPTAKTASLSVDSAEQLAAAAPAEPRSQEIDLENYQLRLQ
ncbi:hypothetical protein QO002_001519 [Pararhizobium capsulatum DSM 1112]|uniref:Uncharacterized protein n=1 Tax=Pararhizobium capsulatum DSM 1112 TaxID=1121113 RepID=A0ABU0BMA3_9HYPH|nr:plant virulence effector HPE1-like domain-containing protein [Pararhizobium capsulatum]MDQ0319381.1 hypothetical protein [Pararhizobium capsulatum DSM 1112]